MSMTQAEMLAMKEKYKNWKEQLTPTKIDTIFQILLRLFAVAEFVRLCLACECLSWIAWACSIRFSFQNHWKVKIHHYFYCTLRTMPYGYSICTYWPMAMTMAFQRLLPSTDYDYCQLWNRMCRNSVAFILLVCRQSLFYDSHTCTRYSQCEFHNRIQKFIWIGAELRVSRAI